MISDPINYPIWGTPATHLVTSSTDFIQVNSDRAGGEYLLPTPALNDFQRMNDKEKSLLTSWLVAQRISGNLIPEISQESSEFYKTRRALKVSEKIDNLIRFLGINSKNISTAFNISESNEIVRKFFLELSAWIESNEAYGATDVRYIIDTCRQRGLIENTSKNSNNNIRLSAKGWEHFDSIGVIGSNSSKAFIAMWFDESMDEAYKIGFEPAIRDSGYSPVRIDKKDHLNKIDDEIIAEI